MKDILAWKTVLSQPREESTDLRGDHTIGLSEIETESRTLGVSTVPFDDRRRSLIPTVAYRHAFVVTLVAFSAAHSYLTFILHTKLQRRGERGKRRCGEKLNFRWKIPRKPRNHFLHMFTLIYINKKSSTQHFIGFKDIPISWLHLYFSKTLIITSNSYGT